MSLHILAPWVPTPPDVVDRMIRLGGITASDVVYDLGCGDGRVVIAAAAQRGARGVGIDIESHWIGEATANAAAAGVSHLVRFEQGDALAADVRPATVVFLYLVEWSTSRVAGILLRDCAPGTRIVSYMYPIDGVPLARREQFTDSAGKSRTLDLAVIEEPPKSARLART